MIAKSFKEAAALVGSKRLHKETNLSTTAEDGMIAKKKPAKQLNFNLEEILEGCDENEDDGFLMRKRHKKGEEKEMIKP